ncbi:MAG: 2-phosphosulfolactate phosphatase [Halobacteriota archaeon]|nr:2-phosphosulfolactate phosphatase [Halobacteriota archaeon]
MSKIIERRELKEADDEGIPVILIDVLRATSTIVTCLAGGAELVHVAREPSDCKGFDGLTIGEVKGVKIDGFDYDNSPSHLDNENFEGKKLAICTTNFSKDFQEVKNTTVYAGSLLNLSATKRLAERLDCYIYPCDRLGKPTIEDHLTSLFTISGYYPNGRIFDLISQGESSRNLESLGKMEEVKFCCQLDRFDFVPMYKPEMGGFVNGNL